MKKILFLSCILLLAKTSFGQTCNDYISVSTPDSRFSINGDEVTDSATGLIWQRCIFGQTGIGCNEGSNSTYNWPSALQAAETESDDTGLPWRVPNVRELRSIVEEKCDNPSINLSIFPNTPSSYFRTSSPYANGAWVVVFNDGNSERFTNIMIGNYHIRLVRDGSN